MSAERILRGVGVSPGLAYAPASDGSGSKHYYIVDRAIDNNDNPNIIDGKMFEVTAPSPLPPGFNTPPTVNAGPDQSVNLPANAILDGTDFVMLSAETASGKYPSRSVQMMSQIIEYTEKSQQIRL